MEIGMDRKFNRAQKFSPAPAKWIRALAVAVAVAGVGLLSGANRPVMAASDVSGTSMSVPLAPDAPTTYVVKKGDTLWDISGVFLRDPWYWPEIWYVNPEIANPHLIYPGDVLHLVYVDGRPRVTVQSAGPVRLSPRVRTEPLDQAVRAIPYDLLMNFVGRPQLIEKKELKNKPYVLGFRDHHIAGSAADEVYARGLKDAPAGSRYTIVDIGSELTDPDDGDVLGYIGYYSGTAEVIDTTFRDRKNEQIAHLDVVDSGREIMQGDRLYPAEVDIGDDFILHAPSDRDLDGRIIGIVDGVYVGGRYQVVAINRGSRHGLEPGHVVSVFARGEEIRDRYSRGMNWERFTANTERIRLPSERSGSVLVFKVYDRMSYALIVESVSAMRVGDGIKHPDFGHRELTVNYPAR
jgi:hypothetical protein